MNKNYSIHLLTNDLLAAAKQIIDKQLGKNYLSLADLKKFIEGESLGLVLLEQTEVIGVSLVKIGKTATIAQELLEGKDWFLSYFQNQKKIALRKHLAIKEEKKGQGLGRLLVEEGMKKLNMDKMAIVSVVWQEGAAHSLGKILQNAGAIPVKNIKNYWAKDSLIKKYNCPLCQRLPCSCSATIYLIASD